MRREAKLLLSKAVDSVVLGIEHFNRPWDRGRHEATLIFIDRSLELLMKAALIHRKCCIRESPDANTFSFKKCVNKCVSEAEPAIFTGEEAVTVRLINGLRDAAQHYFIEISEQELYIYVQACVTLIDDKLKSVFGQSLAQHIPERVLPVSTRAPMDLESVLSVEFDEIKALLAPRSRKSLQAESRLLTMAVLENSLRDDYAQPTALDLGRMKRRIRKGEGWKDLFPGAATLKLSTEGTGLTVSIRITKNEGDPVRLVREGSPEAATASVVAVKRVNELDYYSLGLYGLAEKLGLTSSRTLALIQALNIQEQSDYYREIRIGSTRYKRYSRKALDYLKEQLVQVDMDEIWRRYRSAKNVKAP
jgi:hypothetical protein